MQPYFVPQVQVSGIIALITCSKYYLLRSRDKYKIRLNEMVSLICEQIHKLTLQICCLRAIAVVALSRAESLHSTRNIRSDVYGRQAPLLVILRTQAAEV